MSPVYLERRQHARRRHPHRPELNVPAVSVPGEAAGDHFGPVSFVIAMDNPTSSRLTRERLGWRPSHRDLIQDLEQGSYFDTPKS